MLIVALVLAVVSLAALVTAVVTSNELIAWACIGFSALGVLLLIVDAIRDRHHRAVAPAELSSDRTEVIAPVETTEVIETVESETGVLDFDGDEHGEDVYDDDVADYPDADDLAVVEDHPDELLFDEPDYDTPSDDEPVYPLPAEEAAIHTVTDAELLADSETATSESYYESSERPYPADSAIIIYADQTDPGESSAVIYADDTDDGESVSSGDRFESGSER